MFTDSHCHLTMSEEGNAALERARSSGVGGFVVPATSLDDAADTVSLAQEHMDLWAAVGFHPHEAKRFDDAADREIQRLAGEPRVVAIGEIGLDYHYDHSPREIQQDVLVRQIAIAREFDLPIIVHNRESTDDLIRILEAERGSALRGVIHSFTEGPKAARRFLDLGFMISLSGILTFRSAGSLRETARSLPQDRVMIETDTPYLAPVPHRGKENQPSFVIHVAEILAELWDRPVEEVAATTTANFESFFGVQLQR